MTIQVGLKALSDRAVEDIKQFDTVLLKLFRELDQLDPDLAKRAKERYGDPGLAALILFSAFERLGGKSAMQVAMETRKDPLEIEIPARLSDTDK